MWLFPIVTWCFSREPQVLWQSPGCLHHAMLSSGEASFLLQDIIHQFHTHSLHSQFRKRENHFQSLPLLLCPQVHGIANDTIQFVQNIINTEINSATDNPVSYPCFPDEKIQFCHWIKSQFKVEPWIGYHLWKLQLIYFSWLLLKMVFAERGETISGGNFHGEYPAKVRLSAIPRLTFTLVVFVLLSFIAFSVLAGSGLFSHCCPRAGLYQWAEDRATV